MYYIIYYKLIIWLQSFYIYRFDSFRFLIGFRLVLPSIFCWSHFGCLHTWCPASATMPFKGKDGSLLPTCDVELVCREWKDNPSVRLVCANQGRLFEPSKQRTSPDAEITVKINIKDCVRNMYVLIPCLKRMAKHDHHPVPYVKSLAQEKLAFSLAI